MTYPSSEITSDPVSEDGGGPQEKASAVAGAASEQAAAVAGTAKDQAANVAGTAKEQTANVAGAATEQARNLLAEAQQEFGSQATAQKDKAVTGLRALSKDLASMAEHSEDGGVAGHVVSEAAKRSGTLADYLEEREPGHILDDLRDLGRRRTGGFLLGAAVLGFAGGRLLKGARADTGTTSSEAVATSGAAAAPPPPAAPAPGAATVPTASPTVGAFEAVPDPDGEPSTLTGRYGSLASTPSLLSPDDV